MDIHPPWDRFQIPKPFTTIHGYFGEPLFYREGEGVEQYRKRIEPALNDLEREHDPIEAELTAVAVLRRQEAKRSACSENGKRHFPSRC